VSSCPDPFDKQSIQNFRPKYLMDSNLDESVVMFKTDIIDKKDLRTSLCRYKVFCGEIYGIKKEDFSKLFASKNNDGDQSRPGDNLFEEIKNNI